MCAGCRERYQGSIIEEMMDNKHPLSQKMDAFVAVVDEDHVTKSLDLFLLAAANGIEVLMQGGRASSITNRLAKLAEWAYENPDKAAEIYSQAGFDRY